MADLQTRYKNLKILVETRKGSIDLFFDFHSQGRRCGFMAPAPGGFR